MAELFCPEIDFSRDMCSPSWMFSIITRRTKSGAWRWCSKVNSASSRRAATGCSFPRSNASSAWRTPA